VINADNCGQGRLEGIQNLRGLAAVCVVMYHIQLLADKEEVDSLFVNNAIFAHMYYGVDIFFVISGFIMARTLASRDISAFQFVKNRLVRIVPLYWVLTLLLFFGINLVADVLSIKSFTYIELLYSLTFTSELMQNQVPIIDQGWSLEYEMIFYLLITVAMLFSRGMRAIYLAICVLIAFWSLGMDQIILEFAYGVGIYLLVSRYEWSSLLLKFATFLGIVLLVLVSIMDVGNEYRVLHYGFPAALIVLGGSSSNLKRRKKLSLLGDISYSLYLSQSVALYWLVEISNYLPSGYLQTIFLISVIPLTCILLGYSVYKFLERPLSIKIKSIL
jgi:exopolysaccharide production protein ExoZ